MAAITPEQAQDLVEHFGGQCAAARAVGAHQATIKYWLDGEHARSRMHVANMTPEIVERRRRYDRERKRKRRTDPDLRERERARGRDHYYGLSGQAYGALLLRHRRNKALKRRELRLANRED
jgi:hypothetical protein